MSDMIQTCAADGEFEQSVLAIQQARTNFQIRHFVVGQHDTDARRFHQCVNELHIKVMNLKRSQIHKRQLERKIKATRNGTEEERDEAALMRLDMEQLDLAIIGAVREAQTLYAIFKSFPKKYTREEMDDAEEEYWQKRLTRQASHELISTGRVGVGNLDSLAQIGKPVTTAFIREIEEQLCIPQSPEQSAD